MFSVLNSCVVPSLTVLQTGNQAEDQAGPRWSQMVSSHWFRGAWRSIEQQLSVSSCSHFLIKILCDDYSSKTKDTASQAIQGTGYTYMISYLMSLLQPVQKHLSCPTALIKFYLLVLKLYKYSETNATSESSHTPVGSNDNRQAEIHQLIIQIWGIAALKWQKTCLNLMTVI